MCISITEMTNFPKTKILMCVVSFPEVPYSIKHSKYWNFNHLFTLAVSLWVVNQTKAAAFKSSNRNCWIQIFLCTTTWKDVSSKQDLSVKWSSYPSSLLEVSKTTYFLVQSGENWVSNSLDISSIDQCCQGIYAYG